ncbi:MAG: DUF5312 domain-containing protein [Treponema sp.]|jgi:hypothetical protein|nr:DUF5312 domain-containing protein [Treponema sp.]
MAEMDTLERLATNLPLEERQKMFERLQTLSKLSEESLYPVSANEKTEPALSVEKQYTALPWYFRLFYFILSIFKNKTPQQIFTDAQISKLGNRIDTEYPGFYNYRNGLLLTDFNRLLAALKEDARFFFDALDISVNRDRGDFYSFLGSLEMPEIHRALEVETEPQELRARNPVIPDSELRQSALRVMEEIFTRITEVQRTAMYRNARALYCLKELASFLYDRVLLAFSSGEGSCSIKVVKEMLGSLNNILFSLKDPPSLALLESLFIFILQERAMLPVPAKTGSGNGVAANGNLITGDAGYGSAGYGNGTTGSAGYGNGTTGDAVPSNAVPGDADAGYGDAGYGASKDLQRLLNRAEKALINIRNFNRRLPLTLILKCGNRDISYYPRQISGGEDWYTVYRDYWRRYITARFTAYMKNRRREELGEIYRIFFGGAEPAGLANAAGENNTEGFPLSVAPALSFLLGFYKLVFVPKINPLLLPLVAEGGFNNKENRTEFTGAYNDLAKLGTDIQNLDEKIGAGGIYGERYAQARQDMSSLPIKRRKIQLVLEDAGEDGRQIIERARLAADTIVNIITGIVNKESGRYDSLSNLALFEVKFPGFPVKLRETGEQLKETLKTLDAIAVLETELEKN